MIIIFAADDTLPLISLSRRYYACRRYVVYLISPPSPPFRFQRAAFFISAHAFITPPRHNMLPPHSSSLPCCCCHAPLPFDCHFTPLLRRVSFAALYSPLRRQIL